MCVDGNQPSGCELLVFCKEHLGPVSGPLIFDNWVNELMASIINWM